MNINSDIENMLLDDGADSVVHFELWIERLTAEARAEIGEKAQAKDVPGLVIGAQKGFSRTIGDSRRSAAPKWPRSLQTREPGLRP